ncbi:MAG: hypothetical protein U0165_19450 [Polyangiaceae bacterium]
MRYLMSSGISGAENMSGAQLRAELDRGGRVVVFDYCISIIVLTFQRRSDPVLIRAGSGTFGAALPAHRKVDVWWWGFPFGLIYTPLAVIKDLSGGTDTPTIRE